ncbi:PfkB family carbohydrate kinase [Trueperella pyogenes]|uniref:PfkB family carbohydrate kinase n=1 Tax=Trueperella pyogenes TaxID=1661 RepID=UPI0023DDB15D|nr:PfkB family carbohydrate kinase [Trueperella pyogenes]
MTRMVNTGSVIVDQVIRLDKLPPAGGDVIARGSEFVAGGGLNSMLGASRYGMDVLYCGVVGTGPFSDIIIDALEREGITSVYPRVPDVDNGYCVAFVEDCAERTFVTTIGVEGDFGYEHLSALDVRDDDMVYVSGYSLATENNAEGLARWLGEIAEDVVVVVDPSPLITQLPRALFDPLVKRADIWSCNEREAHALAGAANDMANAKKMKSLLKPNATVVIRAGSAPTVVCMPDYEVVSVPTFPTNASDTNGAGDVHVGVMMAALADGASLIDAVTRANAASAIMVSRSGPNTAPTRAEIEEFMASS